MRLFPPFHRPNGRRPRLPQSLPLRLFPVRNLHTRLRSLPNPGPINPFPRSSGTFDRGMSPFCSRNPVVEFPDGGDAQLGVCGVGGRTTGGVCVGDGVEWSVYFEIELEVGVFLFCGGAFGGLGGGAWWGLRRWRVVEPVRLGAFWRKVYWIGAGLVSSSLGMFFYVLAYLPPDYSSFSFCLCEFGMLMVGLWRMRRGRL